MKKYDRWIVAAIVIYVLLALGIAHFIRKRYDERDGAYRVEQNRVAALAAEWAEGAQPDAQTADSAGRASELAERIAGLEAEQYRYIRSVDFLPAEEKRQDVVTLFFREPNSAVQGSLQKEIVPIYAYEELVGFLRMDIEKQTGRLPVLIGTELALFLLELFVLAVLLYLRTQVIMPFWRMQELPRELAEGNLQGGIRQEKSRYFGQFEWGLSQLRDELEAKRKRELELLRERKLLLLSLSHDIKTPLSTIALYNRALEQGVYDSPEKRAEIYGQIALKLKEIEAYMEELLTSSREEIVEIRVEPGEFYLRELIDRVRAVYQEKCDLRKIQLTIGSYEDRLLHGDICRLVEVFENLFENAFKYGDGKRIAITFDEEDQCQLISVYNSGEPIAENDFPHIFESFFRGANTHGRQGYGLGLYIAKEIMDRLGGEIYAECMEDGMTFVVVLPLYGKRGFADCEEE